MQNYYIGSEIKFVIDLTAEGFSMDTDDFDIVCSCQGSQIQGNKANSIDNDGQLIIFRDDETGTWYGILDTAGLSAGTVKVVGTAHVPDSNANDGIRKEIDVQQLAKLSYP